MKLLAGNINWVCSDHACCESEKKIDQTRSDDIFSARSGFGGTEWMLSGLYTEGRRPIEVAGPQVHPNSPLVYRRKARSLAPAHGSISVLQPGAAIRFVKFEGRH